MTDLTNVLPQQSKTVEAIFAHYKQAGDSEPKRGYLGASILGHSCDRYLWYCFRQCCKPEFDGRMYRLFETGDLAEARFVADLRAIGCEVHDVDPATGQQFEVLALGGHFSGHMDGCVLGLPEAPKTWHVTEFKTHNAKSFTRLKSKGVQEAKPQHYGQMQAYMHLTGMKRALYLAVNKDTDELYSERVHYDKTKAGALMDRARRIITTNEPPPRIAARSDWYECKWCDARDLCWATGDKPLPLPSISCRQCCLATPMMDGHARWVCEKHARSLAPADQDRACEDHLLLPGLLPFADPIDHGKDSQGHDYITFQLGELGVIWHGRGQGCCTSQELCAVPVTALVNSAVATAKGLFDAAATGFCADDILARYPAADSRIVWQGRASQLVAAWKEQYGEELGDLEPVVKCDGGDYRAAEYGRDRVAIFYPITKEAEIREGVS